MFNHRRPRIGVRLEAATIRVCPSLFRFGFANSRLFGSAAYGIYLSAAENPKVNERSRQLVPSI